MIYLLAEFKMSRLMSLFNKQTSSNTGASKQRTGRHWIQWLGWAGVIVPIQAFSAQCDISVNTYATNTAHNQKYCLCTTTDTTPITVWFGAFNATTSNLDSTDNSGISICSSNSDTTCTAPQPASLTNNQTVYIRNNTATPAEYLSCQWDAGGAGFSTHGYTIYTPTNTPTSADIGIALPLIASSFALLGVAGFARRNKKGIAK